MLSEVSTWRKSLAESSKAHLSSSCSMDKATFISTTKNFLRTVTRVEPISCYPRLRFLFRDHITASELKELKRLCDVLSMALQHRHKRYFVTDKCAKTLQCVPLADPMVFGQDTSFATKSRSPTTSLGATLSKAGKCQRAKGKSLLAKSTMKRRRGKDVMCTRSEPVITTYSLSSPNFDDRRGGQLGVQTRSMVRSRVSSAVSLLDYQSASSEPTNDICTCTVCEHAGDVTSSVFEQLLLATARECGREFVHSHLLKMFKNLFERLNEIFCFEVWASPPDEENSQLDIDFLQAMYEEKFTSLLMKYEDWESFTFRSPDMIVQVPTGPVVCVIEFQHDPLVPNELEELVLSTCGCFARNTPASETLAISITYNWTASVYMSFIEDYRCKLLFIDKYNLLCGDSLCQFSQTIVNFIRSIVHIEKNFSFEF